MGNCDSSVCNEPSTALEVSNDNEVLSSVHKGSVLGMTSSFNNNCFYTCGDDKRIAKIGVTVDRWKVQKYFDGHVKSVNRVCINDDGTCLWSAARDLSLKQWNISCDEYSDNSKQCLQTFSEAHTLNIADLTINKNGDRLFSGSRDYSVKIWDTQTGKCISEFKAPRNVVTCLTIDGIIDTLLYQGSEDLCVRVWDTRSPSRLPAMHITDYIYFPTSICLHSSKNLLVTGCKGFNSTGCEIKLMDLRMAGRVVTEYRGHGQDVTNCKIYDDSILSCSKDGSVCIWGIDECAQRVTTMYKNKVVDDKLYTGISLIGADSTLKFVVSSFDGSITLMTYDKTLSKLSSVPLSEAYFYASNAYQP